MSEPKWNIEQEREKFVAGQDDEIDGRLIFSWIEEYWNNDAELNGEVIELASQSCRDQIIGGLDAMLLCYRSCLLDAIEGRIIRP